MVLGSLFWPGFGFAGVDWWWGDKVSGVIWEDEKGMGHFYNVKK